MRGGLHLAAPRRDEKPQSDLFVLFCFGLVCFVLVWFGLVCFVLFCFGLVWFCLVCFVLVWFGWFCFVLFCFVLFCFGLVWFGLFVCLFVYLFVCLFVCLLFHVLFLKDALIVIIQSLIYVNVLLSFGDFLVGLKGQSEFEGLFSSLFLLLGGVWFGGLVSLVSPVIPTIDFFKAFEQRPLGQDFLVAGKILELFRFPAQASQVTAGNLRWDGAPSLWTTYKVSRLSFEGCIRALAVDVPL